MYLVSIFLYPPLDVIIPLIGESCKFIRVFLFFFLFFFFFKYGYLYFPDQLQYFEYRCYT